jgi:uncharacterized protein (DUF697 family)
MSVHEQYEAWEAGPFESYETESAFGELGMEGPFENGSGEGESGLGELVGETLAEGGYGEMSSESPLSEAQEMALAAELLEITSEEELEQFLGGIIKKVGGFVKGPIGKAIGGVLKKVAKTALPMVGGALGNLVLPGVGGALGSKLGGMASKLFELEAEFLASEQGEFEVARRIVRLTAGAAQNAARAPSNAPPAAVAQAAIAQAARQHAPGLLDPRVARAVAQATRNGVPSAGMAPTMGARSGRWVRRGQKIVVVGA